MGVRITKQDDAKSPGSDGASPYLTQSCSSSSSIFWIVSDQKRVMGGLSG